MRWWLALAMALVAAIGLARPAAASSDGWSCQVRWRVASANAGCAGIALLRPGNDSQLNLFLLIADRRGGFPEGFDYYARVPEARSLGRTFTMWSDLRGQFIPVEERDGYRPTYADPPGSCERLALVRKEFFAAVEANPAIPAAERRLLKAARLELETGCAVPPKYAWNDPEPTLTYSPRWPSGIASAPGKALLDYLVAAHSFYREDWTTARNQFAALTNAADPWVAETARYMAIRIELDDAYALPANDYGYRQNATVKPSAPERAMQAITAYQAAWPSGRYYADAEGMKRRLFALRDDWRGLAKALSGQTHNGPRDGVATARLVEEIVNYLMGRAAQRTGALSDPLLLAAWDLMAMRIAEEQPWYGDYGPPLDQLYPALGRKFTRKDLTNQATIFAGDQDLYAFLDATFAYYHERDFKRVLALIPAQTGATHSTALGLSRQALRALALTQLGDPAATAQWTVLLASATAPYQREAIELGLAQDLVQTGKIDAIFARGSLVRDTELRTHLLQFTAGRDILRRAASDRTRPNRERDMAAFALLYKDLSNGHYAHFARDRLLVRPNAASDAWFGDLALRATVPAGLFVRGATARGGFACPDLVETARRLAANSDSPHDLLCLGDFWRISGFDRFYTDNMMPKAGDIAAAPPQFPGEPLERGDIYLKVLADPATAPADRAYALYRAVWCYASAGRNTCGGKDVDQTQRRAWFTELKSRHPGSPWARKLKYYW